VGLVYWDIHVLAAGVSHTRPDGGIGTAP
jgi:hypothetical protein